MKKLSFLILLFALFLFAGCGNRDTKESSTEAPTETVKESESESSSVDDRKNPVTDFSNLEKIKVGETVPNFEAVLCDGTKVTLDALLEKYDAVFIDFWATWCGPCKEELPFLNKCAGEGKVAFLCLSPEDTAEEVALFMEENNYENILAGEDVYLMNEYFDVSGYPSCFIIDRNKTFCFSSVGCIGTEELLRRILSVYTKEDYSESVILEDYPKKAYEGSKNTDAELTKALCPSGTLAFKNSDGEYDWPFLVDGSKVTASNTQYLSTSSRIITTVEAKKGDVFAIDYDIYTEELTHFLALYVNGKGTRFVSGEEKSTLVYRFPEDGTYEIALSYIVKSFDLWEDAHVNLMNARLLKENEAGNLLGDYVSPVQVLEGNVTRMDVLSEDADVLLFFYDGKRIDEGFTVYYMPEDSIDIRVCIGKELPLDLWYIVDFASDELLTYKNAYAMDRFGYRMKISTIYEDNAYNEIYTNNVQDYDDYEMFIILNEPKDIDDLITMIAEWDAMDKDKYSLVFADDYYKEVRDGRHGMIVTDVTGKALSGVKASVCRDNVCTVVELDKEMHFFENDEYKNCTVKIISAPVGYSFDPDKEYTMPTDENLVIELECDE